MALPFLLAAGGTGLLKGGLDYIQGERQAREAARARRDQMQATREAIAEQRAQREQTRADMMPYMRRGGQALEALYSGLMGGEFSAPEFDFQGVNMAEDPGVQYRMDAARKALEASAAARGGLLGAGTQRALIRESQGLASQEFGNAYARQYGAAADRYNRQYGARQDYANRLQGLAGSGQSAAAGMGSLGAQAANQIGALGMSGASAAAAARNDIAALRRKNYDDTWNNAMDTGMSLLKLYGGG